MTEFPVSDGTIEKITCEHDSLCIEFLDWQEELWEITFEHVLGVKSLGAVGTEVSEMFLENATSLSQELILIDASEIGTSYCFTSARDNNVVLTIVASGYAAKKII
ncbi:hypothetical protein ACEN9D_07665 [Pseudomonas sp. CT11-2]|uniref:hypothetical protein n=1 Tax=unclassified Pseudomonas TaxID=196821 RepID=UPI00037F6039|nr:hypothetical protein [Pseudomonas sp. B21-019]UVM35109.1 hypothetical protein LOY36_10560 [Pseudomonas sp. B21-019]